VAKINRSAIALCGTANSSGILTDFRVNLLVLSIQAEILHSGELNPLPLLCKMCVVCGSFIGRKLGAEQLVA